MKPATKIRDVTIGPDTFPYSIWEGEELDSPLAFDTETEVIEDLHRQVPRMVLGTASDGERSVIFSPEDLPRFIETHIEHEWTGHNLAFDFWVVHSELERQSSPSGMLWEMLDDNQFVDTMLFDMLIRLARHDAYPSPRNLAVVASEYGNVLGINKNDPWRMRYGELLGTPLDRFPTEALDYAISDAIATIKAFEGMCHQAWERSERAGIDQETRNKWGSLTVGIQTKAAIAFAAIERRGIAIDSGKVAQVRKVLDDRLEGAAGELRSLPYSEGLFKYDKKTGMLSRTKSGVPSLSTKQLRFVLEGIVTEIELDTKREIEIPRTATGGISASVPEWDDYIKLHPFLESWATMQETGKLLQFFSRIEDRERVHPRYTVMVRTGRTSARDPNIQQIPRADGIRELFVASEGYLLAQIDYSFIELRTLAAECESRYGFSQLANVIREGIDPHVYTAALINEVSPEEFASWKETNPKRFKSDRQSAKAVNFGIPGGLGPKNLAKYAHRTYGVEMSEDTARELREKIITIVYPELQEYLSEDSFSIISRSLQCDRGELIKWVCRDEVPSAPIAGAIRKIILGNPFKRDGTPYNPDFVDNVWNILAYLNTNATIQEALDKREAGVDLMRLVTYSPVRTLSGRVRGRVSYSQARNTPFQGLAADGAKLAIYRLVREGYRVVGFVHDEILIELEDRGGFVSLDTLRYIESVMVEEMERICPLPIAVESAIGRQWSKGAGIRIEGDRAYPS